MSQSPLVQVHNHAWLWAGFFLVVFALVAFVVLLERRFGGGSPQDKPESPPPRWVPWLVAGLVVSVGLVFAGLGLWPAHPSGRPPSDRWVNVMTGLGATTAAAGVVIGGVWALLYGRKASVAVSAEVHPLPLPPGGFLLVARPKVKAVGLFRVTFHRDQGARVDVREVFLDPAAISGLRISDYRRSEVAAFGGQHADGGEELPTSVVFLLPEPAPEVAGWMVWLKIQAPERFGRVMRHRTGAWADRIFVPIPERPPQGGG